MFLSTFDTDKEVVSSAERELSNNLLLMCNNGDLRNDCTRKTLYRQELNYIESTAYLLAVDDNKMVQFRQYNPIKLTIQAQKRLYS